MEAQVFVAVATAAKLETSFSSIAQHQRLRWPSLVFWFWFSDWLGVLIPRLAYIFSAVKPKQFTALTGRIRNEFKARQRTFPKRMRPLRMRRVSPISLFTCIHSLCHVCQLPTTAYSTFTYIISAYNQSLAIVLQLA